MITFFSYETMWIAVVAFLALLALCFFAYCRYECWLAKKLNPYVVAYQSDHDLEKLKQGLDHWRPWALSRHSQNIITANWFSALLEQKHWAEAEETLEQFLHRAKNKQDKNGISSASDRLRKGYRRYWIRGTGTTSEPTAEKISLETKRENQEYSQAPKRVNMLSFAGSLSALVWHCSESSAISPPGTQSLDRLEPEFLFWACSRSQSA